MADTRTFDETLAIARRLPPRDQARLIARLAEDLAADESRTTNGDDAATATNPRPGDPRAVVAEMLRLGPWEGDDLEERLAAVYAARAPLRFEGAEDVE